MTRYYDLISDAVGNSIHSLKEYGQIVDSGHWQGVPTEGRPDLVTKELCNVAWAASIPGTIEALANAVGPNLPWADDHFEERVSRVPSNPGEQYKNWPWWAPEKTASSWTEDKFTHTYQERFWPKWAGYDKHTHKSNTRGAPGYKDGILGGIRYTYGDLDDVVNLLVREPMTRQATFPIFFPEDTGAVHGGRIPCTLHYHFMLRNNQLHLWYPIRSCDAVRHFRDDVYMACRLCYWMIKACGDRARGLEEQGGYSPWLEPPKPGFLHFSAYSFHVHMGDYHLLQS